MTEAVPQGIPNPVAANLAQQPASPEEALRGNLTAFVDRVTAHYGQLTQEGQHGRDFNYTKGRSERPPYSTVEGYDYPDGTRREVVARPDGTTATTVRLSRAVVDGFGRRAVVGLTEGGEQPSTYSLGFSESDKRLTRKQRADGVSVKGFAHYTWGPEQPISTTRGGTRNYPVEADTPQFAEVATVSGQVERGWQNTLENLNPNDTYKLPHTVRRGVTALGAVAAKLARRAVRH